MKIASPVPQGRVGKRFPARPHPEQFLAEFNGIVSQAVLGNADNFYGERGLRIHGVEVRSIACKDPNTQQILLEIIQETTNRLNGLLKQEGENEVKLKQMQEEIQAEALKGELLELRRQHAHAEALIAGEAEAIKVKAFFEGLGDNLSPADKLAIFNTLRKQDALEVHIAQPLLRKYLGQHPLPTRRYR